MKIVLDTNVLISGVFWKGSPRTVLTLWAKQKIQILVTKNILTEYMRVLHKIDKKGDETIKWGTFIVENSKMIEDKNITNICRDSEDNKFLNCAIEGKAKYIVSGDDDLLSLKTIREIKIITPVRFLKLYKKL
ncbi:putative toxin-antitoxin system toxin component, PIN family [Candidatus Gracilibacteria bacterium]|nr:putative toxin-antitoxin system toxin component, PIN family [Candidatus Gracilibacteria bacterium]